MSVYYLCKLFRDVFFLSSGFLIIGIPLGYHYRENNLDPPITVNVDAI